MAHQREWVMGMVGVTLVFMLSGFAGKSNGAAKEGVSELVWMARPSGARSCEPDSGLRWTQVLALMKEAQVRVHRVADGLDGKRRVQLCGTPTGRWIGVQISSSDVAQVEATGWKPWPSEIRKENEKDASELLKQD
jgi:hypothetical protein